MNILYYIIFSLVFFFGQNIVLSTGMDLPQYQMILSILWIICILYNKEIQYSYKGRFVLLFFTATVFILKNFTDDSDGTRFITMNIIVAPLAILALPRLHEESYAEDVTIRRALIRIFFSAYVLNCVWAILERIFLTNVFEAQGSTDVEFEALGVLAFRSNGIYGHPLYNALVTSIGMVFLLTSNIKGKIKYSLWLLGMIALFCFNARTAILINIASMAFHIAHIIFGRTTSARRKLMLLLGATIVTVLLYNLITKFNLGGRLLEFGYSLEDGSSQTRLDVWRIIPLLKWDTIAMGTTADEYQTYKRLAGILVTENFWIDWLIRFGIVFLIGYVILSYRVIRELFSSYNKFNSWLISATFLVVASCNNSLFLNGMAAVMFLYLADAFNPYYSNEIIPESFYEETEDEEYPNDIVEENENIEDETNTFIP